MKPHLKSVLNIQLFKSEKKKLVKRVLLGKFYNYSILIGNNHHNKIIMKISNDGILIKDSLIMIGKTNHY